MLAINTKSATKKEVSIKEWNDKVKAFVKPLTATEFMVFNDLFRVWSNPEKTTEERVESALSACILVLVDDKGKQLLDVSQLPELKRASFKPMSRVMNTVINVELLDETYQKN